VVVLFARDYSSGASNDGTAKKKEGEEEGILLEVELRSTETAAVNHSFLGSAI